MLTLYIVAGVCAAVAVAAITWVLFFRESLEPQPRAATEAPGATAWRVVRLLSGVAIGVGAYLGLSTINVAAINGTQDCGTAFVSSGYSSAGSAIVAECDSKRSDRREIAIAFIGAGVVAALYSLSQRR